MFVLLPSVNMFKITMIWRWQIYSLMPLCTIVITGETCTHICHMAERLDPQADSIDRLVCRSTKTLIQGSIWCVIGARVSGVESTGNRGKGEFIQRNKLYVVGCGMVNTYLQNEGNWSPEEGGWVSVQVVFWVNWIQRKNMPHTSYSLGPWQHCLTSALYCYIHIHWSGPNYSNYLF